MNSFKKQVYELVRKVPKGKVMTYGRIAQALGRRVHFRGEKFSHLGDGQLARAVGNALHGNTDLSVPCHRVVDRNGRLAPNFSFGGWKEQRKRLETEGVKFKDEMHVDLAKSFWQENSNF